MFLATKRARLCVCVYIYICVCVCVCVCVVRAFVRVCCTSIAIIYI